MYYGHNRYICTVFEEMRTQLKVLPLTTREKSLLASLVEEAQIMANRMEGGLEDQQDLVALHNEINKAKKELTDLKKEIEELEEAKPEPKD